MAIAPINRCSRLASGDHPTSQPLNTRSSIAAMMAALVSAIANAIQWSFLLGGAKQLPHIVRSA